jgi:predicted amidohydrolase
MTLPRRSLTVAACAWALDWHPDWAAFAARLSDSVARAAAQGADIAVLPEYAGLEAVFTGRRAPASVAEWCARSAARAGVYAALCAGLAQRHGLTLLSGSLPVRPGAGATAFVNRAYLCRPDGRVLPVDKQVLTPWERSASPLVAGWVLPALDAPEGRIAALICYDAEFPPLCHALTPDLLLVPSCTEAPAGAARVRVAARARALEAQAIVVHAPLLGAIPECEIVDANTGRAAIFAPPDHGFPSDGILAQGEVDRPGWVLAHLPAGCLSEDRAAGAVAPRAHMPEAVQRASACMPARTRED